MTHSAAEANRPMVGIGVIIIKNGKVLLGLRKGSHGAGTWALPGGHLEFNESIETCTEREVLEEVGIMIGNIEKVTFTNDIFAKEGKHYVTCYVKARYMSGRVRRMEPDKCLKWKWCKWGEFPEPLFIGLPELLREIADPTIPAHKA